MRGGAGELWLVVAAERPAGDVPSPSGGPDGEGGRGGGEEEVFGGD